MNTDMLANVIQNVFGFQATCSIKKEERQIIIRLFQVPMDRKESLELAIYDMERILVPDGDVFFSVIAYTPEETDRYYPQMAQRAPVTVCDGNLTYRNEMPSASDVDDKFSKVILAA